MKRDRAGRITRRRLFIFAQTMKRDDTNKNNFSKNIFISPPGAIFQQHLLGTGGGTILYTRRLFQYQTHRGGVLECSRQGRKNRLNRKYGACRGIYRTHYRPIKKEGHIKSNPRGDPAGDPRRENMQGAAG